MTATLTNLFNTPVKDKITAEQARLFASVIGSPGVLAVALASTGATRYWCITHQRIFPVKDHCPECIQEEKKQ